MRRGAGEARAHVIGDARFAGGIDDARGKLGNKDARFQADTGFQAEKPPGFEKFFQRVQQEAEFKRGIFLADPEDAEQLRLELLAVNTNAAAADFTPVQHQVVGTGTGFSRI